MATHSLLFSLPCLCLHNPLSSLSSLSSISLCTPGRNRICLPMLSPSEKPQLIKSKKVNRFLNPTLTMQKPSNSRPEIQKPNIPPTLLNVEPVSNNPSYGSLLTASQMAQATGGTLIIDGIPGPICTDTRKLKKGDWFLALQGPNFDGHDFLSFAESEGCAGILAQMAPPDWSRGFVKVKDTLTALQDLATYVRGQFGGPVVAITGSSGKTTTRAMTGLALESLGYIHQTAGNLNNHVGVPLTLLAMPYGSSVCVLELGMNHSGEIALLTEISVPSVRVVLNVGPVHLGSLGSMEGVAQAKGEIFLSARPGDVCLINGDDPFVAPLPVPTGVQVIRFGTTENCDVRLLRVETTKKGFGVKATLESSLGGNNQTSDVEITSPGLHLALDACAAAAIALSLGVSLEEAVKSISKYTPVGSRLKVEEIVVKKQLSSGETKGIGQERKDGQLEAENEIVDENSSKVDTITIINDSYNANPVSVNKALELLASVDCPSPGKRVALLGDMLELGELTGAWHMEVLETCTELGVDLVGIVGKSFLSAHELMKTVGTQCKAVRWIVSESEELGLCVQEFLEPGDIVLVKGSRGIRMDKIVDSIKQEFGTIP